MFFWAYVLVGAINWLVVALILIAAAFLPSLIAFIRRHHNRYAILVLNVLLGWTLVGWAVALVWSLTAVWRRSGLAYET